MASLVQQMVAEGKGVIGDAKAFTDDCRGTLGFLSFPYQDAALAFEFDTATTPNSWVLRRSTVVFCENGVGDVATETGFQLAQTIADTSLLKNGYFSSSAYFTVKGLALRPSSLPYDPTAAVSDADSTSLAVDRVGISRNDCQGIAGALVKGALEGAYVEYAATDRTCATLLGRVEEMPQGFGIASDNDSTNGQRGCGQMAQFRRSITVQPGSITAEWVFRLTFGRKIGIPADPSFAAPADNECTVAKLTAFFDGYFSDANGMPLLADSPEMDITEYIIASNSKLGY